MESRYRHLDMNGQPGGNTPVKDELEIRFTYHAPKADQPERYEAIRAAVHLAAELICAVCPPSRERSLALTELESAAMWANASIARRDYDPPVEG